MSLLAIKALAALAIFAATIVGGIIPLLAARREQSRRLFSLGNALAGGLFLGVGFLHLLPESFEQLEEVAHYPLAPLLAALGLGGLLLIDRVIFSGEHTPGLPDDAKQPRTIYPYVLLGMLSVHSVIAGISLGVGDHIAPTLILLTGILAHKGSAAFALIVSAHAGGLNARTQRFVLVLFSLTTPAGIVIGIAGATFAGGTAGPLFVGGFNALAAGTFIYIAILDIINEELSPQHVRTARSLISSLGGDEGEHVPSDDDRILKFALIITGMALMAVLVEVAHVH